MTGDDFFKAAFDAHEASSSVVTAIEKGNYLQAKVHAMKAEKLTKSLCDILRKEVLDLICKTHATRNSDLRGS